MLEYLKNHIIEELDGAVEYWEKALELKGTEEGYWFKQMADMELEHANCLNQMFHKADKKEENASKISTTTVVKPINNMYKEILDAYTESMNKIQAMKKMYYK